MVIGGYSFGGYWFFNLLGQLVAISGYW